LQFRDIPALPEVLHSPHHSVSGSAGLEVAVLVETLVLSCTAVEFLDAVVAVQVAALEGEEPHGRGTGGVGTHAAARDVKSINLFDGHLTTIGLGGLHWRLP